MNEEVCTSQSVESKSTTNMAGRETAKLCLLPNRNAAIARKRNRNPERNENGAGAKGARIATCKNDIVLQCSNASKRAAATASVNTHARTGAW